jgi:cobalt-precorrin-7 (C5)-methyltransferase
MIIVGVGAGPGMLTQEAMKAISKARMIYGSERAIEIAYRHLSPDCSVHIIEDYKKLQQLPEGAVVLSTGDPMLSGLGYLDGQVIPGISSMQVACARLKISQLRMVPVTLHGRSIATDSLDRIVLEIKADRYVFLLTDDSTNLAEICRHLEAEGLSKDVAVLTDLGYPEERIELARTNNPPAAPGLSCVVIGDISKESHISS